VVLGGRVGNVGVPGLLLGGGPGGRVLVHEPRRAGPKIFQGYGAGNMARRQSIRAKYDPFKPYAHLMPGGWKVANA
jgi:hypothetical protein